MSWKWIEDRRGDYWGDPDRSNPPEKQIRIKQRRADKALRNNVEAFIKECERERTPWMWSNQLPTEYVDQLKHEFYLPETWKRLDRFPVVLRGSRQRMVQRRRDNGSTGHNAMVSDLIERWIQLRKMTLINGHWPKSAIVMLHGFSSRYPRQRVDIIYYEYRTYIDGKEVYPTEEQLKSLLTLNAQLALVAKSDAMLLEVELTQ